MADAINFLTPVGRLVSGHLRELNKKDHQGRDLPPEKYNWFVGLAFPKTAQNWWDEQGELGAVFTAIRTAAYDHYKGAEFQNKDFAWKIDNGDDPKHAGKEGYAGHWILKFTRYVGKNNMPPVKVVDPSNADILDPMQMKRGWHYRIAGGVLANGNSGDQAGVYMNMNMVQLSGIGQEITSGPSAAQLFGTPAVLPAGVQAAPAMSMPAAPALPGGPVSTPPAPAAPVSTPPAPAAPVSTPPAPAAPASTPPAPAAPAAAPGTVPAPNFAQGGGYAPAPAAEVKRMFGGGAWTEAQLRAGGHTDAQIASYPIAQ